MSRKVGSPKGKKAKADKLFSQLVRSNGQCLRCGTIANLQCAHIHSRRFLDYRWDESNAICLCARCHIHMTDHPTEFARWLESEFPTLWTQSLSNYEQLHHHPPKKRPPDFIDHVIERLEARLRDEC